IINSAVQRTFDTANRLITDTTVSKELLLCHQHYGWTLDTIKEILVAGFKSAFLAYREKADLLKEITAELDRIQPSGNGKGHAAARDAGSVTRTRGAGAGMPLATDIGD